MFLPLECILGNDSVTLKLRDKFMSYLLGLSSSLYHELRIKLAFMDIMGLNGKFNSERYQTHELCIQGLEKFCETLFQGKQSLSNDYSDTSSFIEKQRGRQIYKHKYLAQVLDECKQDTYEILEAKLTEIIHMFMMELGDYFNLFCYKNAKSIEKWLEEFLTLHRKKSKFGSSNKSTLELYADKLKKNKILLEQYKIDPEDLNIKYVIDSDFNFIDFLSREHTDDWNINYMDLDKHEYLVSWNSNHDYSSDLELRNSKIVGYINESIDDVVSATHYDTHIEYIFQDIEWHEYIPIRKEVSTQKYPCAIMTCIFKFGFFAPRGIQFVDSSRTTFSENHMVENVMLFKSSDYVKDASNKDLIKCPFLGARTYYRLDVDRTRYVEVRSANLGGFLNKKFIYTNPISAKKLCLQNYNGIMLALKKYKEYGKAIPSPSNNYLSKILHDYINHYCQK